MTRWEPFSEIARMREEMDRVLDDLWPRTYSSRRAETVRLLPVDMYETQDAVIVKASVAGIRPDDISITVTGNNVTIQGQRNEERETREGQVIHRERWFGSFRRDITLPTTAQADQAEATFENGVLTLKLPKSPEAKARRIQVKGTSGQQLQSGSGQTSQGMQGQGQGMQSQSTQQGQGSQSQGTQGQGGSQGQQRQGPR